jgi:3-phenylpropionate/trans-cinnamate dioxygenase ferredoxin reductase subunit
MTLSKSALVVVGSGPAGLSAARAYRKAGGVGGVLLVTADLYLPYNRPPLSKDFLRGESGLNELPLEDEAFYVDHEIEVLLGQRVTELVPGENRVVLGDGETVAFDRCVLATGSAPNPLPVDGGDHPDLLMLRSRVDGERLRAAAEGAGSAVVIGFGFIGCEAAASLAGRGLSVTVVSTEELPQAGRLGTEVGGRIAGWLDDAGVRLIGGVDVTSLPGGHRVQLADDTEYAADLVLVAAGVTPQIDLAESAGLHTQQGRVVVDEQLRTSADNVFAAGDIAHARNVAAGRRLSVEHWGDAERMGEIAGTCAAGGDDRWAQAPGFWSEIGEHTLKYAAWGDGYDELRFVPHEHGGFTAWYGQNGTTVGVLTHRADDDYQHGQRLVEDGAAWTG